MEPTHEAAVDEVSQYWDSMIVQTDDVIRLLRQRIRANARLPHTTERISAAEELALFHVCYVNYFGTKTDQTMRLWRCLTDQRYYHHRLDKLPDYVMKSFQEGIRQDLDPSIFLHYQMSVELPPSASYSEEQFANAFVKTKERQIFAYLDP